MPSRRNVGGNGFRMPDVIANLRVDQAWGFTGVSFTVHDASGAYYGGGDASTTAIPPTARLDGCAANC